MFYILLFDESTNYWEVLDTTIVKLYDTKGILYFVLRILTDFLDSAYLRNRK